MLRRQRQLFKNATSQSLAKRRQKLEPLIQALKAVQARRMSGDEAYQQFLAKFMSYDDWLVQQDTYSRPELMMALELLADQTLHDIQTRPDNGVRITLIEEKVGQKIDAEIAATNPDYKDYLKAAQDNDEVGMKSISEHHPDYVAKEHAKWWSERLSKTKIEVIDQRFSGVRDWLVMALTAASE